MASQLLPPSPNGSPPGSAFWNDWYEKLRKLVNDASNFAFTALNFSGSNLTSIAVRQHNDLQSIQGGTTADYQHLTTAQLNQLKIITVTAAPTTGTLPSGNWGIYKNTTSGTLALYANDSGTIKAVNLT